jgi:hypothetical protein
MTKSEKDLLAAQKTIAAMPRVMWNADQEAREKIQVFLSRGLIVVNSTRPMNGEAWEGHFLRGIHYSAGDANDPKLAQHWRDYGGHIVDLVDNGILETMARLKYQSLSEYKLKKQPDAKIRTWEECAEKYGLPRWMKLFTPGLPYRSEAEG